MSPDHLSDFNPDFPITSISVAQSAVLRIPLLILDLWPQIFLLISFAAFVVWNGGVVLGDKENHVATVHLPQMLYIWPLIVFFSWPVLLPQFCHLPTLLRRVPRLTTTITFLILMLAAVNLNTVIHPFTLADNRHYTFYIFRILTKHWAIKYAAVPVYFVCACLVLGALGGASEPDPTSKSFRILHGDDTVCVSFALIWLVSTALSLITAPLVEPRYFILPWLLWRLAVPEYIPRPKAQSTLIEVGERAGSAKTSTSHSTAHLGSVLQSVLKIAASYSTGIELMWYIIINLATCYIFLYKGFEWPQEPGNVQRFMW